MPFQRLKARVSLDAYRLQLATGEDAKLHLGVLMIQAGQKVKAVQVLKAITGTDGTADLARLWILRINQG